MRLRYLRPNGMRGYTLGGTGVRLAGQWRVGVVARRHGVGRPVARRKIIGVASTPSLPCKKMREIILSNENFGSTSLARQRVGLHGASVGVSVFCVRGRAALARFD